MSVRTYFKKIITDVHGSQTYEIRLFVLSLNYHRAKKSTISIKTSIKLYMPGTAHRNKQKKKFLIEMILFLFSRKQLQVLEKHVMDSKRMAERVIKSGKRTIDEIHILIQNHIISMQRREHELISKAEKIQQVIACFEILLFVVLDFREGPEMLKQFTVLVTMFFLFQMKCQVLQNQIDAVEHSAQSLKTMIEEAERNLNNGNDLRILKGRLVKHLSFISCEKPGEG